MIMIYLIDRLDRERSYKIFGLNIQFYEPSI